MIVQPITRYSYGDGFRDRLGTLIETVGTPRFAAELMRVADEVVSCGHVSAFALSGTDNPRVLLAANRGTSSVAYAAGSTYVSQFWNRDPINAITVPDHDLEGGLAVHLPAQEFLSSSYRRSCYSAIGWSSSGSQLIERFSILKRHQSELVRINFYRSKEAGPFEARDIELITSSADILFALLARHCQVGLPPQKAQSRTDYEELLRRIAPNLSKREVEVCAGIALGMTSEAIASVLGIGINTVVTYRKRAYARLGISSHNELLRAVFSAATTAGYIDTPAVMHSEPVAETAQSRLPH